MIIQRQALRLNLKEITEAGSFKGYASTRTKDLAGDIMAEGCFKRTIDQNKGRFPILFFHDPCCPVGMSSMMEEDGHGLYTEGQVDMDIEDGRRVVSGMRKGYIDRLSIGFSTIKDEYDNEQEARVIKEVRLWEYSLITKNFAAQPEALITGVKSRLFSPEWKGVVSFQDFPLLDAGTAWDGAAAEAAVRKWAKAEDGPNAQYRKAFVWYDSDAPDDFDSYKLPIATVEDGKLKAVPKGILAAAGACVGARGGVDIPDSDMDGVKNHLGRYYKKMGVESPWNKSLDEVMAILKSGRVLSSSNRGLVERALDALQALLTAASEEDDSGKSHSPSEADLAGLAAEIKGGNMLLSLKQTLETNNRLLKGRA